MLKRVMEPGSEHLDRYRDTRAPLYLFEPSTENAGWYREVNHDLWVYYHAETSQYQFQDSTWWDPVSNRVFAQVGTTYQAGDGSGDYEYDENADAYLLCYVVPPGPAIDQAGAKAWLGANYADTRAKALHLIKGNTAVDKTGAWRMLDNWNAAYPAQWIRYEEVGLLPVNRAQDLAGAGGHQQQAPVPAVTRNPSRSYRLARQPAAGTAIALPSDAEVNANVDFYWQGKGDEAGGDAAGRKEDKHGFDPVRPYRFARANSRRWFAQRGMPNHLIFHNFDPASRGATVYMAVWNWTSGEMVTFYDINHTVPGGVEDYLRDRGLV